MKRDDEPARVFINWIYDEQDHWEASWQRGPEERSIVGTREECLRWAREQAADERLIFDGTEFVPLRDTD